MKFPVLLFLFLFVVQSGFTQSIVFDDAASVSDFSYHKDNSNLICFYKTWESDNQFSRYRTVVVNSDLQFTDTVNYKLPGNCSNIGSGENDQYGYHIFYTRTGEKEQLKESITFLITDKYGKVLAKYEKSEAEITALAGKKIKMKELQFKSITTSGKDASTLLLFPAAVTKAGVLRWLTPLIALNVLDGSLKWKFPEDRIMQNPAAINGRLVAMQLDRYGATHIHCYNLATGQHSSEFPVSSPIRRRAISVFQVNDTSITVGGSDAAPSDRNSKHARFFLTRFDFTGRQFFDRIDTVERLPGNRLQIIEGAFTQDGNIIVIGESYKIDAAAVAAKAVAFTVLAGARVGVAVPTGDNRIIQSIVSQQISPAGDFNEFHSFPVESRKTFSEVIRDHRQVYLRNKNQLLWYDLTNLASAPRKFTTILDNQEIFTFHGNLIGVRMDNAKKEIILEVLKGDRQDAN